MNEERQAVEKVVEIRKGENDHIVTPVKNSTMITMNTVKKEYSETVQTIRNICIWIVILSMTLMSMVAIISIWSGWDNDVSGKAIATMFIVGLAAGVIMLVAPALDKKTD